MHPPCIDGSNTVSEQRRSVRFDTYLNARVSNGWQERCPALVTNISHEGLRLEGGRELVDIVFPYSATPRSVVDNVVTLQLMLEEGVRFSDSNSIEIRCRSSYVLRHKPDRFQIGFCYQALDERVVIHLEAFIIELQGSQGGWQG